MGAPRLRGFPQAYNNLTTFVKGWIDSKSHIHLNKINMCEILSGYRPNTKKISKHTKYPIKGLQEHHVTQKTQKKG